RNSRSCIFIAHDIQIEPAQADQLAWRAEHAKVAYAEVGEDLRAEAVTSPLRGRIGARPRRCSRQAVEQGFGFAGFAEYDDDPAILGVDPAQGRGHGKAEVVTAQMEHVGQGV